MTYKISAYKSHSRQAGLTLVELLIALIIGLIVIGIAFLGFQSNQNAYNAKVRLDNTQEAARYTAHTIGRMVRNATSLDGSTSTSLAVTYAGGAGIRNCLGTDTASGTNPVDTFTLSGDTLVCQRPSPPGDELVDGITDITFTAFALSSTGTVETTSWANADAVRVIVTFEGGRTVNFVATVRNRILSRVPAAN